MGDHRVHFKIEASFHGVERKCDSSINWSPDTSDCPPLDQRMIDFFKELYEEGMDRFYAREAEMRAREEASRIEEAEREELRRLKEKYEE